MKIVFFAILINASILITGCSKSKKYSEIKVGMTYDEVEAILEKPVSITRGANELELDLDGRARGYLTSLVVTTDEGEIDSTRWYAPMKVKTLGNLIYVTWIYDKTKKDTFYVLKKTFKEVTDTVKSKIPIYYLGAKKVSKAEFEKSDGYEYRLHDNRIVDKSFYDAYKKSKFYQLPPPKKINKNIKYKTKTSLESKEVRDSVIKEYYEVDNKYCIIFDASSGRVTNIGYFPFYVSQLN